MSRHINVQLVVLLGLSVLLLAIPCRAQEPVEEPASPPEERSSLTVTVTVCTAVEDRDPVGEGSVFPATVEKLFCHTLVEGAEEPTSVTHVWYHGEEKMAEVILSVNSPHWRTWSSKRIVPGWTGDWRVDVLDEAGEPLASIAFQVE
ncbi:DUF2914 domain-containing protein [Candidatus Zixiibacteriota bacterium]